MRREKRREKSERRRGKGTDCEVGENTEAVTEAGGN